MEWGFRLIPGLLIKRDQIGFVIGVIVVGGVVCCSFLMLFCFFVLNFSFFLLGRNPDL